MGPESAIPLNPHPLAMPASLIQVQPDLAPFRAFGAPSLFLDPSGDSTAQTLERIPLLVVDDEPASLAITARMLSGEGFQVHQAASGIEALDKLARHPDVRLALVDVIMAAMNGLTLAGKIQESYPQCRVILMTGYAPEQSVLGNALSSYPLLLKPFSEGELVEKVKLTLKIGH
jgi:two-component system cell cycle sensor histidine kinase/response regulator CckA